MRSLGGRAALPQVAATADCSSILEQDFPALARIARDPTALFRPNPTFQRTPPRVTKILAPDYAQYVLKGGFGGSLPLAPWR